MSDLFRLTDGQMERLRPFLPRIYRRLRIDDRSVSSSIILVNRNGLRRREAPKDYRSAKTLHNRLQRWDEMDVFVRMMRD